jgi:hypothetical protein
MIYSAMDKNKPFTMGLNGVYAHGELEEFLGYDVIETGGLEMFMAYNGIKLKEHRRYICDTYAVNNQGETRKVTCYLWHDIDNQFPRGLVVCHDNKKDIDYALAHWGLRSGEL